MADQVSMINYKMENIVSTANSEFSLAHYQMNYSNQLLSWLNLLPFVF